jgi:uncharacterized membrane protein
MRRQLWLALMLAATVEIGSVGAALCLRSWQILGLGVLLGAVIQVAAALLAYRAFNRITYPREEG